MKTNCQQHFRKAVEILDPNIMIIQSKGYWKYIAGIFEHVSIITDDLYKVHLGDSEILVASFTHPSTPDNEHNWGRSADTPYLKNIVVPTIVRLKSILLGSESVVDTVTKPKTEFDDFPKNTVRNKGELMISTIDYETFYSQMRTNLRTLLPENILAHKPEYKVRGNRMAIYLDQIAGSHYEICFRQGYHEFALHFESTPERSLARRQVFDPLLVQLSEKVGKQVRSGRHENCGWMRIWIELPVAPLTEKLVTEYTELIVRFMTATFPALKTRYQQESAEKA